jgi:RNA polymerase sigma-70 factor (ECF subfamily)
MDEQQERAIARGLRDGDADAWRALYEAFSERAWRCVARLMPPSSAEVADVVQETFLAAARSARSFDPARGNLWGWLWGIARRGVALHYRKQGRRDRLGTTGDDASLSVSTGREEAPPEALAAAELTAQVRVTLSELSAEYEMLLTTHYLEGGTVEQLAGQANSTATAIRSKLARARRAFREAFCKRVPPPQGSPARTNHDPTGR